MSDENNQLTGNSPYSLEKYLPEKCIFELKLKDPQQPRLGNEAVITIFYVSTVQEIIDKLHGVANGLERAFRPDLSGNEPSLGGDKREE
jgi:hypothetical protein